MSTTQRGNPGEALVRLHLVAPQHLEPTPSKGVTGRFDRVLRDVGSTGGIAVRARMITAVASTKFRTLNHRPVSLVGLHGKDDLLVLGPAWAVERLMRGEQPATKTDAIQTIHPRKVVEDELRLLDRVPGLLKAVRSLPTSELAGLTIESSQHREAFTASRTLGALFRANVVDILEYFDRNDSDAFLVEMRAEAAAVLHRVNEEFVDLGTAYPEWWATWLEDNRLDVTDVLITKSGRHVSSYLVSKRANAEYLRKPRNNDLAEYLTEA